VISHVCRGEQLEVGAEQVTDNLKQLNLCFSFFLHMYAQSQRATTAITLSYCAVYAVRV
jgi:hypothetical protein